MTAIDFTKMTAHAINDRQARFNNIVNSVGWGNPVVEAPDIKGRDATAILTDTGVMIIRSLDNVIITAWVASVPQAISVWRRATNKKEMPKALWNTVNYNNNTSYWQKKAVA